MRTTSFRTVATLNLLFPALLWSGCQSAAATAAQLPAVPSSDQHAPEPSISADQLRAAATDPTTRRFYEENGWRAVWSDAAERALQHSLGERARHGLDRRAFIANSKPSPSAADREVAVTQTAPAYAEALDRRHASSDSQNSAMLTSHDPRYL